MKIKLGKNFYMFENLIKYLNDLVIEIEPIFKKDKMIIQATETSNVAMTTIELDKSFFDEYEVDEKETFGLNISSLKAMLRRMNAPVTIVNEKNRLTISDDKKKFSLPNIDTDAGEQKFKKPNIEYKTKIKTTVDNLIGAMDDIRVVDNQSFTFEIKDGKFTAKARDLGSVKVVIEGEIEGENTEAKFGTKLFSKIICTAFTDCVLYIGKDIPISIHYKVDNLKMETILAPRIITDIIGGRT